LFAKKRISSTRQLALSSILSAVLAPHINTIGGKDEQNTGISLGHNKRFVGFRSHNGKYCTCQISFFERLYSGQLPPEVFPYANMIAIGLPVFGIALAAYLCGMIALLALIEGHLKAIKEQGESYRPNKARERSEPNITA